MFLTKMTLMLFSLLMVLLSASAVNGQVTLVKWVVLKEGMVKVNGSTNVNKFSCGVTGYTGADTIICYKNSNKDNITALAGRLVVSIARFDCGNAMMTNDLRKTLKAKEFPSLSISFVSLERYPGSISRQELIRGVVTIELAGASKRFEVSYRVSTNGQDIIQLVGTQNIRFSDFNLTPPRKLGGMIRADDRLDVTFHINFRMISG